MQTVSENIILGIVSGLIATLLTIGFRSLWISVLTPWFEELVYKDAKIEGLWFVIFEGFQPDRYEVLNIVRKGHKVTALMTCAGGIDKGITYTLAGTFRNLILTATYEQDERTSLDRGSMTLMLTQNGEVFKGEISFYNVQKHSVDSSNAVAYRSKEDFEFAFKIRTNESDD